MSKEFKSKHDLEQHQALEIYKKLKKRAHDRKNKENIDMESNETFSNNQFQNKKARLQKR